MRLPHFIHLLLSLKRHMILEKVSECALFVLFFVGEVYGRFCALHVICTTSYQLKLTAARLEKSTAQWLRLANSSRIFTNLSWYDSTSYILLTKTTAAQTEVVLSYHNVRGLYFLEVVLEVVFTTTIVCT